MKTMIPLVCAACLAAPVAAAAADVWPDGSAMDDWFLHDEAVGEPTGRVYRLTDYGVYPDEGKVRTGAIQGVIDRAAQAGGGTVVVTPGVFRTGALFFRPGVNLHLQPGAVLLGSDDIADYPVVETRIEGQTVPYFAALLNADRCDGFTLSGQGTVDGNGFRAWRAFWIRRKWNRACTNKDEQRPRLLFVSNSRNVRVDGVNLQNSWFWTTHYHRCDFLKITNVRLYALAKPDDVKGPSTDGIDLDACRDVVVRNVWISNNDDGVCMKGGKGAFADDYARFPGNGDNERILIEGLTAVAGCHSAVTLGSEAVHCRNVVFRNSTVDGVGNLLNLKMRTDTPQLYENVLVENVRGKCSTFALFASWSQFADLEGRTAADVLSRARNVTFRDCEVSCGFFTKFGERSAMHLQDIAFENLRIAAAKDKSRHEDRFDGVRFENVEVR